MAVWLGGGMVGGVGGGGGGDGDGGLGGWGWEWGEDGVGGGEVRWELRGWWKGVGGGCCWYGGEDTLG